MMKAADTERESLRRELRTVQGKIDTALHALEEGQFTFASIIMERLRKYEDRREALKHEMESATRRSEGQLITASRERVIARLKAMEELLARGSTHHIKEALWMNIREIVVFPTKRVKLTVNPEGLLGGVQEGVCLKWVPEVRIILGAQQVTVAFSDLRCIAESTWNTFQSRVY